MEFFTILLSALLGLVAPTGLVIEQVTASAIRGQLKDAETLAVRLDNTPNYRLVQGRIERLRIAGRGLYPEADVRVAVLEVETDPIVVDAALLRQGEISLKRPVNAGIRLALTRADINRALRSPAVAKRLQNLSLDLLGPTAASAAQRYDLIDPQVEFLDHQRLRFQTRLKAQQSDSQLTIVVESGLAIRAGRQLELIEPTAAIDGRPLPPQLLNLLLGGISQWLDLAALESSGITARILSWELNRDQISLAAFVQIKPQVLDARRANHGPNSQLLATLTQD